ncbi:MAG: DUF3486 family protein [Candidatus Binataceae bacterium]|nr:DUF3486 family protein [Candidatus Binataceae bacterium]
MPKRAAIDLLPLKKRDAIRAFIADRGFGNYRETAREVEKKFGVKLSRAALARYGNKLEHRLEVLRAATVQARAIVEELGADAGAKLGEALLRAAQSHLFDALTKATDAQLGKPDLITLARVAGEIERTSLAHARRADRAEEKIARATRLVAPENSVPGKPMQIGGAPAAPGLDTDALEQIRKTLTGDLDG